MDPEILLSAARSQEDDARSREAGRDPTTPYIQTACRQRTRNILKHRALNTWDRSGFDGWHKKRQALRRALLSAKQHCGEPTYRVCFACGGCPVLLHPAGWHLPTQRHRSDLRRAIRARPRRCNTLLWGFGSGDPSYRPADLTAQRSTCGGVSRGLVFCSPPWIRRPLLSLWRAGSGDPSYSLADLTALQYSLDLVLGGEMDPRAYTT